MDFDLSEEPAVADDEVDLGGSGEMPLVAEEEPVELGDSAVTLGEEAVAEEAVEAAAEEEALEAR